MSCEFRRTFTPGALRWSFIFHNSELSLLKKIKSPIKPFSSKAFVFELFLQNRIHPFYATQIINILTNNKLNIDHSETITTMVNNPTVITDIPDYLEWILLH